MWSRGHERTANVLLSKFFVASGVRVPLQVPLRVPLEESKELCAWLNERLDQLDARDWLRLPAELSAWPHTRWATASTCTLRCLRDALVALSANLVEPLIQDLVDPAKSTPVLADLHEHLARTVGTVVKELLPGLATCVHQEEYTLSALAPAPDGSLSVRLPATVEAALSTAKAKQEALDAARAVLAFLLGSC